MKDLGHGAGIQGIGRKSVAGIGGADHHFPLFNQLYGAFAGFFHQDWRHQSFLSSSSYHPPSGALGNTLRRKSDLSPSIILAYPAAAIIAALSVQRENFGKNTCNPFLFTGLRKDLAQPAVGGNAAGNTQQRSALAPPAARSALATSTSTIASWKLAAISARGSASLRATFP